MPRSIITGTGRAVPDRVVTNDDLAALMDTSDEWIRERTGIQERRWAREGDTGVEYARRAALQALEMAGIAASDLDAIVYATITPDHFLPGNSVFLQRAIGAEKVPSINLANACSGFVYAMAVADAWIRSGMYRRILVVGQEQVSSRLDVSTRGRAVSVIFADGAGAVVLEATDDPGRGVLGFDLHTDGDYAENLWVDGPGAALWPPIGTEHMEAGRYWVHMDGREVFRHAIVRMPESVNAVLSQVGLTPADITLLIPHQANLRISEAVQKRLGLRDDQVYNNIQVYGNTTAGTIPIALDECVRAGRLKPGDVFVMTAFGSGFQWGSAVMRW
jgi:3-oxoacyl-[acyl-carrier-protein] synthase-3